MTLSDAYPCYSIRVFTVNAKDVTDPHQNRKAMADREKKRKEAKVIYERVMRANKLLPEGE